jgi:hypothetical protein
MRAQASSGATAGGLRPTARARRQSRTAGTTPARLLCARKIVSVAVIAHLSALPFARASLAIPTVFLVCLTARILPAHGFTAFLPVTKDAAGNRRAALRRHARADVMGSKAASYGLSPPQADLRFFGCLLTRPQDRRYAPSPDQPWYCRGGDIRSRPNLCTPDHQGGQTNRDS